MDGEGFHRWDEVSVVLRDPMEEVDNCMIAVNNSVNITELVDVVAQRDPCQGVCWCHWRVGNGERVSEGVLSRIEQTEVLGAQTT